MENGGSEWWGVCLALWNNVKFNIVGRRGFVDVLILKLTIYILYILYISYYFRILSQSTELTFTGIFSSFFNTWNLCICYMISYETQVFQASSSIFLYSFKVGFSSGLHEMLGLLLHPVVKYRHLLPVAVLKHSTIFAVLIGSRNWIQLLVSFISQTESTVHWMPSHHGDIGSFP